MGRAGKQKGTVEVTVVSSQPFHDIRVRNYEADLLGGGKGGKPVAIKMPTTLIARERGIEEHAEHESHARDQHGQHAPTGPDDHCRSPRS